MEWPTVTEKLCTFADNMIKIVSILIPFKRIRNALVAKKLEHLLAKMRASSQGIRFDELTQVCDHYFGRPRQQGSSHRGYKIPWSGDQRVNIQSNKGGDKSYQVKQVLKAIEKL